jgi:hypothetical protein
MMSGNVVSKRVNLFFLPFALAFSLVMAATASAGTARLRSVPSWGNPQSCYYGPPNTKCWVYHHNADQGRTSCAVVDIGYNPGSVGPFGYKRWQAASIADAARHEGYQWAGGCYDDDNRDPTRNQYPRETKSTLGEGPDCSGLVWRVWRESNRAYPSNNSFYNWYRSTYDHGPYNTQGFKYASKSQGAPHVAYSKSGVIRMDALASDSHIALLDYRMDNGADMMWEALGEAYGTNENVETYRAQRGYSGVRRLAWG